MVQHLVVKYLLLGVVLAMLGSCSPGERANRVTPSNPLPETNRLEGCWIHTDDTSNVLIFDSLYRWEYAEGMTSWSKTQYILADTCVMPNDTAVQSGGNYLSCPNFDLCWEVLELTDSSLVLSYTSRGNLLVYKRVDGPPLNTPSRNSL
jgi:hypothetical protein